MCADTIPTIPGFRIVRRLGFGGMGAVFLAIEDGSSRAYALKIIAPSSTDPFAEQRFAREIRAVSAVRHDHVVRLQRAGISDGVPYALFERLRGRSGTQVGAQPWPVAVHLGQQIAGAVAAVHAAGWLHRDVKPGNLMVSDRGLVTLIDFGLATRADQPDDLLEPGTVVGTPRYLAPEARVGRPAGTAADVYALGLTIHELLGGTIDERGAVGARAQELPDDLAHLLRRMLAVDPAVRPSAAAVAALLDTLPAIPGVFAVPQRDAGDRTWPVAADQQSTRADGPQSLRRAG